MSTKQNKYITKLIEASLAHTNKLWDDKSQSEAYIVGYLQGTLKQIAVELDDEY